VRHLRALAAGFLFAALAAATTEGATRYWTVSPEVAAPGEHVTIEIHDFGGGGPMFRGKDLYLVPEGSLTDGPLCSAMLGAIKVGVIVWKDSDPYHDGRADFTLPVVPDGDYWLGEQVPGVIPPCHPAGFITVSANGTPDTAMPRPASELGTMLTLAGLVVLLAGAGLARVRVAMGHHGR